jgi:hypothetical protein
MDAITPRAARASPNVFADNENPADMNFSSVAILETTGTKYLGTE